MKKLLFVAVIAASIGFVSCGDSAADQATKDSLAKVTADSLYKDSVSKATPPAPIVPDSSASKMAPDSSASKMAPDSTK